MSTSEIEKVERPESDDEEAWTKYWKSKYQPWRTEPEISMEQQEFLAERRKIIPNRDQGIFPFKDIKLNRADIEWLLSTHDINHVALNWNDESQREREGLDLRGADLREVDLSDLPLAKCNLSNAHLEYTFLRAAHLEDAILINTHLEHAVLSFAHLEDAMLINTHLEHADLRLAHLEDALLFNALLKDANLDLAHLEGANLTHASLVGVNLEGAFFDTATNLEAIVLNDNEQSSASLCDIHWGDVNVAVVDWSTISILRDEKEAKDDKSDFSYEKAARAYRQLSVVLRNQGITEHASRFAYRAQLMQRKVFLYQRKYLSYLGSLFLDLISGYGYKVGRCFIAYAFVIGIFALIYHSLGTHTAWNEAIVISMTAFHGRGFFPDQFHPGDPQAFAAAIEAFVGLLIEITLIATLTQRFFGK